MITMYMVSSSSFIVLGMKSLYSKESSDVGAALSYYSPKLDFWLLVYINY